MKIMDYYSTLGVKKTASSDEIKKAYRSMAMKYHPDRGGDEKKFKEIEEAYRTLSDPQKKQMFDMGMDPNSQHRPNGSWNQNGFEFHFGSGNMDDIFNQFGFGFGHRPQRKNRNVSIGVEISLEDVLVGRDISAEISSGGKSRIVNITIPPGMESGQQIRYQGIGDDAIPGIPPGDLIVHITIRQHPLFKRDGTNILIEKYISILEAIAGCNISIETLDKRILNITVPKGTQPETLLSCKSEGLPDSRTKVRGNLFIKIKINIPANLEQAQIAELKKILV